MMIRKFLLIGFVSVSSFSLADEPPLKIYCSAKPMSCSWLNLQMLQIFNLSSQIEVKSSGDVLRLIEEGNKKGFDLWWGGTGDTHLKAAESDLLRPLHLSNLEDQLFWSRNLLDISGQRSIGIYAGVLGVIVNKKMLSDLSLDIPQCWSDLGDPRYKNQIVIGDPNLSGTAYTFLSTLFQIYKDEKTRPIISDIKQNISHTTTSGYKALVPLINGENAISIVFIHDVVPVLEDNDNLEVIIPCEGTGYEIGAASILKKGSNPRAAQQFIELSTYPEIQNSLASDIGLQIYSNIKTVKSRAYFDDRYFNLINYDFFTYSRPETRKRILELWNALDL
ncbi:extracellular solute-binding protein [Marinomonas primoryensis]|jgi:iron(III) transport system substrate-binding protein|uniref:extracellular solute-binding protein n=1 Tax=Marinomonas primoryensis TaxID=178399 RepID=UPI003703846B